MSSASAAYHQNGTPSRSSGEAEGATDGVEVVNDGGSPEDVPVVEPALVYNKQGEVHELEENVVKAVDGFKVPDGYARKGARDGSFMYSLGVYAEAMEGENHKYFCLASGACRRSRKVIPCKRGDRSNVNTHHRSAHGLQGKSGVMKTEKKKMAQAGFKDSSAASKNSDVETINRNRELLALKLVVDKYLPFNFFSSGTAWTQLMGLLTAETTPFPELTSSRVKHLLVEMFVATRKAVIGNLQQEIKRAVLPIVHYGLDLCTCKVSGRKYLRIRVSYVDSNFTLQHALLAVKHYAPSASVQESEKASEALFTVFRATLAEHGIKLSDLAGGTTGGGGCELEAMCVKILLALHRIGWDRCDRHLADKAAERALGTSTNPEKSGHTGARDVVKLVIETAAKANRSVAYKQRFEEAELELLNETLNTAAHAPQRWPALVRVMERIICSWHSLKKALAADGDHFPLDEGGNKDDFLQLYSLLQPLSAITRDAECGGGLPATAEMRLLFAKLKELVLDPEQPLRVFDVPPSPCSPEATRANDAPGAQKGSDASQGQEQDRRPKPLPCSMMPPGELRPSIVHAREELRKALLRTLYLGVWDKDAVDPSPFRDAAVLLTPPFSSGKYLEALRLTEADGRHLAPEKTGLAPTTDEEVAEKLDGAWADLKARALEAAREDHRRSAARDGDGQPFRKRPRVKSSASSAAATATPPSGYASFRWGGPSVFTSFGRGEGGDSTEDEEELDGSGGGKKLDAIVGEEIGRYRALLIKPKEMDCQNVLTWWRRTGRKMFPYLAPVAQQVFGNQAAVTQGRRDLSGCTNLLALNRSRLDTYWAEMVMFLKENFEQIPALKDIPTIAAKDIHECLPARFHGRDAGLVAAEAAFDVLGNTAYPSANDIVLEG